MKNLMNELRVELVQPSELIQIVTQYYRQAEALDKREIVVPDSSDPRLRIRFDNDRRIISISGTANMSEVRDLQVKIDCTLLGETRRRVRRNVLFSDAPFEGYWEGSEFVLRQAPEDAPRPPTIIGDHPLVIEYDFNATSDSFFNIWRAQRLEHEYLLWLAVFLPCLKPNSRLARSSWILPVPPGIDAEPTAYTPQWLQHFYSIDSLIAESNDFTSRNGLPDIERVADDVYYSWGGRYVGESTKFPESIDLWAAKRPTMSTSNQRRFRLAGYWLGHARSVSVQSKSAAFVSLVQAIEALIPRDDLGLGPTQRFIGFVNNYKGPTDEAEDLGASIRDLYRTRSNLTHGSSLLTADREVNFHWLDPVAANEQKKLENAYHISRRCVINWYDALTGEEK